MRAWRAVAGRVVASAAVAALVALAACGPSTEPVGTRPAADGWHEFEGSWNASGRRHVITLGADRRAALVDLTGTLLLAGPSRPGVGFRGEAIALVDSKTGLTGRAVWTDENGDQVHSELRGEGTAKGNRIEGAIVGGTGRYAGATGSYAFSWQYVVEAEDGAVQGRAVGLAGRVRAGQAAEAAGATGSKP